MKSYPVSFNSRAGTRALCDSRAGTRALCSAACALVLAACGASSAPLFEDVDAPMDMTPDEGNSVTQPPDDGESMPPGDGMPNEPDVMQEPPDDEMPLDGQTPVDEGDGEDGEDGEDPPMEPPEEPPTEPEPTIPTIIEVFPEDDATGVDGDTPIIITFSEPMDQAATEAAYQSERIPSSGVSFSWNEDSTELTITPVEPLAYDSGPDPASVEALVYSFFISSSAQDLEGDSLGTTGEFSFSVLRQIEGVIRTVQDRDLTGNWRSDGTYDGPNANSNCGRNNTQNMCVGDATDNDGWRGFMTFSLSGLPATMTRLTGAMLSFQVTSGDGTPFGNGNQNLGQLMVDRASFPAIGTPAFTAPPNVVGPITQNGVAVGTVLSVNVLSAVAEAAEAGDIAQFRLRFERATDNRGDADVIRSDWDTHALAVTYLIP